MPDFRKQSLYFPADVLRELEREAHRVDRSVSWVVQRCIRKGIAGVRDMPAESTAADVRDVRDAVTDERV